MRKRRHHYVGQHYLRAWTVGGKIACMRCGQVFTTSTTNIAVRESHVASSLGDMQEKDLFPSPRSRGFSPLGAPIWAGTSSAAE